MRSRVGAGPLGQVGAVSLLLAGVLAAGGCTVGTTRSSSGGGTTTTVGSTTSSMASSTTLPAAQNLEVDDGIRAQLVAAGAASRGQPPSDYLGLVAGRTYYALDTRTQIYWAGAQIDPSPNSYAAQVANQDDGGYLIFEKVPGGAWTPTAVGMSGAGGAPCRVPIPAEVLAVWHWSPGSCLPPS